MDPFSAISLCSSVLDLGDQAVRCAKTFKELYESPRGQRDQHARIYECLGNLQAICDGLKKKRDEFVGNGDPEEIQMQKVLNQVMDRISTIVTSLESILSKYRVSGRRTFASVTTAMVWSLMNQSNIERYLLELEHSQQDLSATITTAIIFVLTIPSESLKDPLKTAWLIKYRHQRHKVQLIDQTDERGIFTSNSCSAPRGSHGNISRSGSCHACAEYAA